MTSRALLPYQSAWVADPTPLAVMEKSRRIGISWAEAYHAVMHAGEGRGDIYYQSYAREMTRGFIDDCAGWAEDLGIAAEAAGEVLIGESRDVQAFRIRFASGRAIVAMTSSPRAFRSRGRPGDVAVVDEAAFVDDLEAVLKAALAFRTWGGRVRLISTHNGEGSPFNSLIREIREGRQPGSLHRVSLSDALAQGLYGRIAAIAGQPNTPAAARAWEAALRAQYGRFASEELDCIPAAGGGAWIAWVLLRAAEHPQAGQPRLASLGARFIGIDVARRRDLWVAAVVEDVASTLWLRELVVLRDARFSEQRAEVARLVRSHRPVRIAAEAAGEVLIGESRDVQAFRIRFASGRAIVAMTSSPRAFRSRGRQGDVAVVDEAAFVDDLEAVLKAALAFRTWGGRVRLISTHNGEGSPFNSLIREIREGRQPGSLHRVSLSDALAQGLYGRIAAIAGQPNTPAAARAWEAALRAQYGRFAGEELDCIPAAGGGAWIAWALLRAAEHPQAGQPRLASLEARFIGIDVARRRDLWVAAVVEDVASTLWLRELVVLRDARFSEQRAEVARLVRAHRPVRIAIDQTGMGEAITEQLQDDHGAMMVEGVLMSAPRRLDVATRLREAFEDHRLRIPADEALRADLHAVRAEAGATGAPWLVVQRDARFSEQRAEVGRLVHAHRPVRIAIDQTGMGEAITEQLQDDHGTMMVEGVLMSAPRRLDIATRLREAFEDHRLRIPENEALRADLHAVRAAAGAAGTRGWMPPPPPPWR